MEQEKIICIVGGMGPLAGVDLHRLIIGNTPTNGKDQDHLEVHHFSRSSSIPCRIHFLKNGIGENPAIGAYKTILAGYAAAKAVNKKMVIGIPCNTFHAPLIYDELKLLIEKDSLNVELIHIIEATSKYIQQHFPNVKKIGLLSTQVLRTIGLFEQLLPEQFEVIKVTPNSQTLLDESIHHKVWGLKKGSIPSAQAVTNFNGLAHELKAAGAEAIILGCSEIPLVFREEIFEGIPLINPTEVLAKALISCANPSFS